MRININAKLLLNQKNYILKVKRITAIEIDEIQENIWLKIWNYTGHTKGMNCDKMDMNNKEHPIREQESNNTDLCKTENNKTPRSRRRAAHI